MACFTETERLNRIPHLNDYLDEKNRQMEVGDILECYAVTSQHTRDFIRKKYPVVIRGLLVGWDYFWNDFCPKVHITRRLYYAIAGEHKRSFSRTEILGRLCRAGFRILNDEDEGTELHIFVEKVGEPLPRTESCSSPILCLPRVGKDKKLIKVYKFRTMFSYAQYLQEYVYESNHLQEGGKLKDDFRINFWGRILRPLWLDELPMIWNLIRRDVKLFGVRPISEHYFSLYSPEMQDLRTKVKPGLIPPFYYEKETPRDLDEIQESERRYLEAYLKHPFRTDWKYFWGTLANIIFRRKRSC